jgi:uncharacterized repeat protein (TIGR03803 family)
MGALASLLFAHTSAAAPLQKVRDPIHEVVSRLTPAERMNGSEQMRLAISLPLRNPQGLNDFLRQVYSPTSPNYRHFLSPSEFTEKFGPSKEDYESVLAFARAQGLKVTGTHSNRMIVDVEAPVSTVEGALHVKMHSFQHPREGRKFYAPDSEPTVDLPVAIKGISGLSNYSIPRPHAKSCQVLASGSANGPASGSVKANAGSGPGGTYSGNDFRSAYVPSTSLTGQGQSIAMLEFDGYYADDITYYEDYAGLPHVPLINVLLDGFNGSPSGFGGEVEVALDIEVAIALAPNLSSIIVYEAGPYGNFHDILNRIANDNLAKQVSCSWYSPGAAADPVADQIFLQMAAQGQSFFSASGDYDAFTGLIPFPGDTPYVTEVGGTQLVTSGPQGSYVSESVWNWNNGIGSGGGISTQYAIPDWQQGIDMSANQGSTTMRNVPDVALTADKIYVRSDGQDMNVAGTSAAAPLWAAFAALVNEQATTRGRTVGFLNPALYALASGTNYGTIFHDTTVGDNKSSGSPDQFSATIGYDLCTGLGSPSDPLINALAGPGDPLQVSYCYFSASGLPGGPFLPNTATYSLVNSGSDAIAWSVSANQNWVSLSATSGVLAAGESTAIIATLNANTRGLGSGNYNAAITFVDAATGVNQTRQAHLNVLPQVPVLSVYPSNGFALTGSAQGPFTPASVTYTLTNSGGAPMSWGVSTTASWLDVSPTGGILSVGGTATVTVSANAAANAYLSGTTVTGTLRFANLNNASGDLSVDTTLVVWPLAPVLTSATTASANQGQSFSYQITATNNPTSFRATGLPSGLGINPSTGLISGTPSATGTFACSLNASNPGGTGSGPLTLTVIPKAPVISSTLSVTGTYSLPFTYQIAASNGPTGFAATGLPSGLKLDAQRGLISGTLLSQTGTTNVLLSASNAIGTGTATLAITTAPIPAPSITLPIATVGAFNYSNGDSPAAALIQAADGNFYGTTVYGGYHGYGSVFKLTQSGSLASLYSFNYSDGYAPRGKLIQGKDGNFYGTSSYGGPAGYGTVFKLTSSGTLTTLCGFNNANGDEPMAGLLQAPDGSFYGTTAWGGTNGYGSVFKLSASGSLTTLVSFNYTNGEYPLSEVIRATDGNFYGTTAYGGSNGDGTIFRLSASGSLTTLCSLTSSYYEPSAALIQATDGYFYGTTKYGGAYGYGCVFRVTSSGALSTLCSFTGTNGSNPQAALIQATDGNLYGTTYSGGSSNYGTVFKITTSGSLTTLVNFTGSNGSYPEAALVQAKDGSLYGTTSSGGASGDGTVFQISPLGVTATVGLPFSYQIIGSNYPTSYSTSPLPPGLSVNTKTGLISGTATTPGPWSVNIYALNSGGVGRSTIVINVVLPPVPKITSVLNVTTPQGQPFAYKVEASSNPTAFQAGALPAGCTFDAANALISGIPTVAGTTTVLLGATNPAGTGTANLVITVTPSLPSVTCQPNTFLAFSGSTGGNPVAGVIQGSDGNYYGMTQSDGPGGFGTIFQITPNGQYSVIGSLDGSATGEYPSGPLFQANDGWYYGMAQSGGANGYGTIFRFLPPDPTHGFVANNLWSFSYADGATPLGGLSQGDNGNLYGTTEGGGAKGLGTVFELSLSGSLRSLCSFTGTDGAVPMAGVIQGQDGNFYGTTLYGGSSNLGTVFALTRSGSLRTLCSFTGSNGAQPMAGLVEGSDGNLYGTTLYGGGSNAGTVFAISTSGSLTTLCSFNYSNGANPIAALIEGEDGAFYGSTSSGGSYNLGTVFQITKAGVLQTLYTFAGASDGSNPQAALFEGSDRKLYGTTSSDGLNSNGTVFCLSPLYATAQVGSPFLYQIAGTNGPLTFNATGLPDGLSVDANTGLISGTPSGPGTSSVTLSVTNPAGTGTATLVITVLPLAPEISSALQVTGTSQEAFSYQIGASHAPTSFEATNLPAGLTVDKATGLISGTASASGTSSITLVARNSGGSGSANLVLTMLPPLATIASENATEVVYNAATLTGTVCPQGSLAHVYFEFGTSTSYGSQTSQQDIDSQIETAPVSASVSALLPNTTYHFRLVAINDSGTRFGADQTFATPPPPPSVSTGSADPIFYNAATLAGSANPNGLDTTAYFEYGSSDAYGNVTPEQSLGSGTASVDLSANLTGLSASAPYHYRLVAINSSGTTFGLDCSFVTANPPPTNLSASASNILYNAASLNGSVNPNGLTTTAYFRWGTVSDCPNATDPQDLGNGSEAVPALASLSGLSAATTYYFQLVSLNSSGTTVGGLQSFTTANPPPTVVTGSAGRTTFHNAILNGTVNPNSLETSLYFEWGTSIAYGASTAIQQLGNGSMTVPCSASIEGLQADTVYHYRLVASNSSGTTFGQDQTFIRPADTNADLAWLQLSAGDLTPEFASSQKVYRLNLANSVTSTMLTAFKADQSASMHMRINGGGWTLLRQGQPSAPVLLDRIGGSGNLIEIAVKSQDQTATLTYIVVAYREEQPVTQPASDLSSNSATLNAQIDGNARSVSFQYGRTTAYGSTASASLPLAAVPQQPVSAAIAGLLPATCYHYRVVTTTGTQCDYGADLSFVTPQLNPAYSVASEGQFAPGFVNAKFLRFGNPAIADSNHASFQAKVSGSGLNASNNSGIWLESDGALGLVVRTGTSVGYTDGAGLGSATLTWLGDPVMSGSDQIAFLASAKEGTGSFKGIWSFKPGAGLALVARTHASLDETRWAGAWSGAMIASIQQFALTDQGEVILLATIKGGLGTVSATDQCLWKIASTGQAQLIALTGFPMFAHAGFPIASASAPKIAKLSVLNSSTGVAGQTRAFNASGDLMFAARFSDGSHGVLALDSTGAIKIVNQSGDSAPGVSGTFVAFGSPIMNAAGNAAYKATVSGTGLPRGGRTGIWLESGTSRNLVTAAIEGVPAYYSRPTPPFAVGGVGGLVAQTATLSGLSDPVFNSSNQAAFLATAKYPGTVLRGIWTSGSTGSLTVIAQARDQAPGCASGAIFSAFSQLVLPDSGSAVFAGSLVTGPGGVTGRNNRGLWAADANGQLHLVARTGDLLQSGDQGVNKAIASISVFVPGVATAGQQRSFNHVGGLVYKANFTDGTEAILKVQLP